MIKQIHIKNFKGLSQDIELSGQDIIIAPNFSGKSAILDGLRIAHLGYLPTEKSAIKANSALFKFSSGSEMAVECTADTGERYGLRLALDKKTVKGEVNKPSFGDPAFECMLDPQSYFNATGPAKILMMCSMIGDSSNWDKDQIVKKILSKVSGDFLGEIKARIDGSIKNVSDDNIPAVIDAIEDLLKKEKAECDAAVKRMNQTIRGLADLATLGNELENLPSKQALLKRADEITLDIEGLNREIGKASSQSQQIRNAQSQLQNLKSKVGMNFDETLAQAVSCIQDQESVVNGLQEKLESKKEQFAETQLRVSGLADEHAKVLAENQAVREKLCELLSTESDWVETAPKHGFTGEFVVKATWDDALGLVGPQIIRWLDNSEEQERKAAIQQEEENLNAINKRLDVAQKEHKDEERKLVEIENEIRAIRANLDSEERELSRLQNLKAKTEAEKEGMSAVMEQIESLEKIANQQAPDTAGLHQETEKAEGEIAKVRDMLTKIESLEQDQRRCEEAQAQAEGIQAESKAIADIAKELKGIRKDIIETSVDKGLATANRFTDGIMRAPLEYRDGDIGMMIDGVFAPYETFSGSERALTKMAIGVALAEKSKTKMFVLDEFSVFDNENKIKMICNLATLVEEGIIDQYLIADCREIDQLDQLTTFELPKINIITV